MRDRWILGSLIVFLSLLPGVDRAQEPSEDQIIVIGLDAMKRSTPHAIPASLYRKTIVTGVSAFNEAMEPVLKKRDSSQAQTASEWKLNSIGVGLGMSAQIGLGPLLNLTVSPQLRLIFSDSKNPVYPN